MNHQNHHTTNSQLQSLNLLRNYSQNTCEWNQSHNMFVEKTLDNLNNYTKTWNMTWKLIDQGHHMTFYTQIDGNSCRSIPFELMTYLSNMININAMGSGDLKTSFTYDPESSRIQFNCQGTFEEGYYVRCTNCGNCWDGNAQCMCDLYDDEDTEVITM
jgi:hypothetical protein